MDSMCVTHGDFGSTASGVVAVQQRRLYSERFALGDTDFQLTPKLRMGSKPSILRNETRNWLVTMSDCGVEIRRDPDTRCAALTRSF